MTTLNLPAFRGRLLRATSQLPSSRWGSVAGVARLLGFFRPLVSAHRQVRRRPPLAGQTHEFTHCYDSERKEPEAKGVAQAERLAKLSCRYPEAR